MTGKWTVDDLLDWADNRSNPDAWTKGALRDTEDVAAHIRALADMVRRDEATPDLTDLPTTEAVRDWLYANVEMEYWGNARLWDIDQVLDAIRALRAARPDTEGDDT